MSGGIEVAERFLVGSYWGSRPETVGDCASRLSSCLRGLAAVDEAFSSWFAKGKSKKSAGVPAAIDQTSLERLLARGANRNGGDDEEIPELGFNAALWNARRDSASWSTTCGAKPASRTLMNSFVLNLPAVGSEDGIRLHRPAVLREILQVIVEAWRPDWASLTNYAISSAQSATPGRPILGPLTYLRGPVDEPLMTVAGKKVSVEDMVEGVFIAVAEDPLSVDIPDLVHVAAQVLTNA
ncbi:Imm52 family immunity protein [Kribbella sp. NPDC051587]|uniref:Imm52 family immunity protein n=1 Tax=Kribbella sp. NPDC051587 TaxID=3364119 RepID=UPI0037A98858